MLDQVINVNMIILAREYRGYTQSELAEKIGITQGTLSKIEQNVIGESSKDLSDKLSAALLFPKDFFFQKGDIHKPTIFYRRRVQVTQKILFKVEAGMNILRLHVEKLLRSVEEFPENTLPIYDVVSEGTPEIISKLFRVDAGIPRGPIKNLVDIIEKFGVIVIKYDFESEKIDGFSINTEYKRPIIFINKKYPSDRQRFTLAHELGHMIMHSDHQKINAERDIEDEANRFASELLVPSEEISPVYMSNAITLPLLADLKRYWKVSIAMLLFKTKELHMLTENQNKYLWAQYSKAGFRTREPSDLDFPSEEPQLLKTIIDLYRADLNYSYEEIAQMLYIDLKDFNKIYINRGVLSIA